MPKIMSLCFAVNAWSRHRQTNKQTQSSYINILAEYPPFGRDSASESRGCAWRFPFWVVKGILLDWIQLVHIQFVVFVLLFFGLYYIFVNSIWKTFKVWNENKKLHLCKLFLKFELNDLNLQFLTSGDLKWTWRSKLYSLLHNLNFTLSNKP